MYYRLLVRRPRLWQQRYRTALGRKNSSKNNPNHRNVRKIGYLCNNFELQTENFFSQVSYVGFAEIGRKLRSRLGSLWSWSPFYRKLHEHLARINRLKNNDEF